MPKALTAESLMDPGERVKMLCKLSDVEIDHSIPPRQYFRSGNEMIRMGNVYMEEENLEKAFVLYSKFIILFVEKLPQHSDYKRAPADEKTKVKKKLKEVFPQAEKLKLLLIDRYAEEANQFLLEKKKQEEEQKLRLEKERREREEAKRKADLQLRHDQEQQHLLQTELEKLKLSDKDGKRAIESDVDLGSFEWPSSFAANEDKETHDDPRLSDEDFGIFDPLRPSMPSRQLKPTAGAAKQFDSDGIPMPKVDRSTKPTSILSPWATGQNEQLLRTITVPAELISRFLALAQKNTDRNVETCGILTGKLSRNQFTITHLVVPKQVGAADSCVTQNEEEIFEYQDQHELITLGWIHTHPSQTSFMSSVDLHTHCSYQLMLPEAVAIVCAPKFQTTGLYSLTPDYGLNFIAQCKLLGFHPHPRDPPLYEECAHVKIVTDAPIVVADLR